MPDPVLVPFRAEHLLGLVNRDTMRQDPVSLAIEKEQQGPAFTGLLGETVLVCAGCVIPWAGIGLVWMVVNEAIQGHERWMTRTVRRILQDVVRAYGLHRVEAVVLSDNERNQRWIERLGFSRENGCAQQYTSDQKDVIRYEFIGGH